MRRRAEQMDETRQKIVEAAVQLHGTIGPAETTIAGIARAAGVTRLTVYRHFLDEDAIFAACSAHWLSGQIPPNPAEWSTVSDPIERLRTGLTDLYRFYRAGEAMLTHVYRDKAALPPGRRQAIDDRDSRFCEVLLEPFPGGRGRRRRLRAVVAHAASFWTWHSLCVEHDLADPEAVGAMADLVQATATTSLARRRTGTIGSRPTRA